MPDQPYRGTHRHRAPVGWHPPRIVPETTDAGPDALSSEPTEPLTPTFTGDFPAQPDPVRLQAAEPDYRRGIAVRAASRPSTARRRAELLPVPQALALRPVVAGVWLVAAARGLGLYYWWFHSLDKTPAVFVVLIFLSSALSAAC